MQIYSDQMVGWIKIPLGREVGLGPGDIVHNYNPIIFIAILPTFQTLSSNRHFTLSHQEIFMS